MLYTFIDYEEDVVIFTMPFRKSDIKYFTFDIDIVTNSLIVLEGVIKMIAFGCFHEDGTYFNDYFRGIDFIYCIIHLVCNIYPYP
jgi:hypothetical protein